MSMSETWTWRRKGRAERSRLHLATGHMACRIETSPVRMLVPRRGSVSRMTSGRRDMPNTFVAVKVLSGSSENHKRNGI